MKTHTFLAPYTDGTECFYAEPRISSHAFIDVSGPTFMWGPCKICGKDFYEHETRKTQAAVGRRISTVSVPAERCKRLADDPIHTEGQA